MNPLPGLVNLISTVQTRWQRQRLFKLREIFYQRIVDSMFSKPDAASVKFGQHELRRQSSPTEILLESSSGVLYVTIRSDFEGKEGLYSYSLYLTGDLFRIGLLLYGGLENAPLIDWHNELQSIWPGSQPEQMDREGLTLYEWTFLLPDLYESYAVQERYILGMRHMNDRVLRIIRDYRKVQSQDEAGSFTEGDTVLPAGDWPAAPMPLDAAAVQPK